MGFEPSLLPPTLGLQVILTVGRQFSDADSVPIPEEKGLCYCLLREEPQGIPAEKKYRLMDFTHCALPNWKRTDCWLFQKQKCSWAEADEEHWAPPEGVFTAQLRVPAAKVCLRNTCSLPKLSAGTAARQRWFPWLSGTHHLAAEIM